MSFDPRRDIWGYTPAEINEMDPGELTALYNAREADLAAREKPLKPIEPGSFTEIAFQSELKRLQADDEEGGTFAELWTRQIDPLRWVVDGLVAEGLSILAGKPKLGKSWLALGVALSVCAGSETLGLTTSRGEVLYVALEDGERRLQDRIRRIGQPGPHLRNLHYRTSWPTLNNGGFTHLEDWMSTHPDTRLIIIDTYGRIRGELPDRNQYAEESNLLGPLQKFAVDHRVAVLLVHHLRKSAADDWLEQVSGSQAFTGVADTLLGLFRERGQMDATLRLVSRDAPEFDLALKFEGGQWESMGDASAYRMSEERRAALDALSDLGGEAKVSEVADQLDSTSRNVSKLLVRLAADKLVERVRHGVYALVTTPTVETREVVDTVETVDKPVLTPLGKVVEVVDMDKEFPPLPPGPIERTCTVCGLVIDPANGDATTHPACDPEEDPW